MGGYFLLAGSSHILPFFLRKYFMVHSESTSAITMSPGRGVAERSASTRSFSMIPASTIESPETLNMKVAFLFSIRYSSKEIVSTNSSSAGVGKPACTNPRIFNGVARFCGMRRPEASLVKKFSPISREINLKTEFFDLNFKMRAISEYDGMRLLAR